MATAEQPPTLNQTYRRAIWGSVVSRFRVTGNLRALPAEPMLSQHPGVSRHELQGYGELFPAADTADQGERSLPSVLIHTAVFPAQMALMSAESFPLPLLGMVHLRNEVHHREPLAVQEPFRVSVLAQNLGTHSKGTTVEILAQIFRQDADDSAYPIWEGVSLYLAKNVYLDDAASAGGSALTTAPADQPERQRSLPQASAATAQWQLDAATGRRFAAVSGDYNPIHLTGVSARALGMPGAIAHGMYSAARVLAGREPAQAGHRWWISFASPIVLPARVSLAVKTTDEHQGLSFTGWNPRRGKEHFSAEITWPR